jgi:hypothetical protein
MMLTANGHWHGADGIDGRAAVRRCLSPGATCATARPSAPSSRSSTSPAASGGLSLPPQRLCGQCLSTVEGWQSCTVPRRPLAPSPITPRPCAQYLALGRDRPAAQGGHLHQRVREMLTRPPPPAHSVIGSQWVQSPRHGDPIAPPLAARKPCRQWGRGGRLSGWVAVPCCTPGRCRRWAM